MPNELPLPPDMQHLIEKRSGEERRGPSGEPVAADARETESVPAEEKTDSAERRKTDRRGGD